MKTDPQTPCGEQTLFSTLTEYAQSGPARFHMPGHKGRLKSDPLAALAPFDVTELRDTDDLAEPTGVLNKLEKRYSDLYNAGSCMLLVNGSTAGNIAMLLATGCGRRVILARDCHKSALSGIALAGHEVFSIYPDEASGTITPQAVKSVLKKFPADAVFITSPTYYGACSDTDAIAEAAHEHGALLFVDAAHGAHFPFSKRLPPVPASADAWTVSCHKTLNAFTQTAVLNIGRSCPIPHEHFRRMLTLVQSSSPSYPLMLSLENAITEIGDWDAHCERICVLRKRLSKIPGLHILENDKAAHRDVTRLVLGFQCLTGYELGRMLEHDGIFAEMCDLKNAVFITTPSDPESWYSRLLDSLSNISNMLGSSQKQGSHLSGCEHDLCEAQPPAGRTVLSLRNAMLGDAETLPLSDAVGRIAAQAVGIYPPGIATLFPGESITQGAVDMLMLNVKNSAKLFGASCEGDAGRMLINVVKRT